MIHLFTLWLPLLLSTEAQAFETIPANEADSIAQVTQMITEGVQAEADHNGKARRDAHAKAHGCVKAQFSVNSNLPSELQSTVFQPGKEYKSWIRFSNGSKDNDQEGDGRGMAIKLTGVSGEKLLEGERNTQDFLMINHPVFFIRNNADYVDFFQATTSGSPLKFFFPGINPAHWRLHELNIGRTIRGKETKNPLEIRYWSMTPYLFNNQAMKFMARPASSLNDSNPNKENPNYLREEMAKTLQSKNVYYEFYIQLQKDKNLMPIEDPTVLWDENVSTPVKVATIEIPKQSFQSPTQMDFCENLSLNPWHSVPEHRPLGGINRARKVVYETISKLRHELNKESLIEPTGNESF